MASAVAMEYGVMDGYLVVGNVYRLLPSPINRSIGACNGHRWIGCTIYSVDGVCRLSMDSVHNLLWCTMTIDGWVQRLLRSIMARYTPHTIYCDMAITIDRHLTQSVVAGHDHRWTRFTIH